MAPRKRGRAEMKASESVQLPSLLARLRNTWEFANIMQYIYIFGKVVKIDDDFDIEARTSSDLENACLQSEHSEKLAEIGLCLLKFVSSHRGLTPELFDEYTRRQYVAKASKRNPYGTDEEPKRFSEFDVFTKLRVLFQLSQWTLINPDRLRERMPEGKDTEQTAWRIEELGYDKEDHLYFVLDDNRLYRRTDPGLPPPPPRKPKANSKAGRAAARAAKRRKVAEEQSIATDSDDVEKDKEEYQPEEVDTFGGRKWECIAVTLGEYQEFLESIRKSRDPNEKVLYSRLAEEVMPVIEKLEEERQKKLARRQKELLNMEKMVHAKRSSRIASKFEKEKEEAEAAAAERKRQVDLAAARKDVERQRQMDAARQSRMMTREQRLKEREYKRLLHEEELANLSEDSKKLETGEARMSERQLKAEMERKRRELEALKEEEEWVFDCSKCGVHGENIDDGSHSISCERCNVWQHSACLGVSQADAEKEDFHFVCIDCKRKEEDAKKPKIPSLKFKVSPTSKKSRVYDEDMINGTSQDSDIANSPTTSPSTIRVEVPRRIVDAVPTTNGTSPSNSDDTIELENNNSPTHFMNDKPAKTHLHQQTNGTTIKPFTTIPTTQVSHPSTKMMSNGLGTKNEEPQVSKSDWKTNGVHENDTAHLHEDEVSMDIDMINGQVPVPPVNGISHGHEKALTSQTVGGQD